MILKCRFCAEPLSHTFCDLGSTPISNFFLAKENLEKEEPVFPLHVYVCGHCFLVQLPEIKSPREIFHNDYAYFSSYSDSWLKHCQKYTSEMIQRFKLDRSKQIIEIASNDGYLLQYFVERNIPVLGIEPAENVAEAAEKKGISTLNDFFGKAVAHSLKNQGKQADLLIGNNVLAHVPNLNDFIAGLKILLSPIGVITMEFPHLVRLIELNQFDTIYHEHYSYLSFSTVEKMFAEHGLKIFDVEELNTHGGSLRIYAAHCENQLIDEQKNVENIRAYERIQGYQALPKYLEFKQNVVGIKKNLTEFLKTAFSQQKKVVGYGAPAKGNTLLNFCDIKKTLLSFTVDRSPHKQGKFLPGSKIPIYSIEKIFEECPDYLLILPWNLKEEILENMKEIRRWGGKFLIPIPSLEVIS